MDLHGQTVRWWVKVAIDGKTQSPQMVLKDKLLDDSAGLQSKCNLLPGTGFVLKCQHSQCKCALCFQCVHNHPISELSVKSPARMNSKKT